MIWDHTLKPHDFYPFHCQLLPFTGYPLMFDRSKLLAQNSREDKLCFDKLAGSNGDASEAYAAERRAREFWNYNTNYHINSFPPFPLFARFYSLNSKPTLASLFSWARETQVFMSSSVETTYTWSRPSTFSTTTPPVWGHIIIRETKRQSHTNEDTHTHIYIYIYANYCIYWGLTIASKSRLPAASIICLISTGDGRIWGVKKKFSPCMMWRWRARARDECRRKPWDLSESESWRQKFEASSGTYIGWRIFL